MKAIIRTLFVSSSNSTLPQLFRYTFVGGFAFLVDFGLLYVLTEHAGAHYLLSATVSFVAGLLVNYTLSKVWVFNTSTYENKKLEFLLFAGIGIAGLAVNDACLWLLSSVLGLWYMLSKVITTIITYLWNFFARKYLLFR